MLISEEEINLRRHYVPFKNPTFAREYIRIKTNRHLVWKCQQKNIIQTKALTFSFGKQKILNNIYLEVPWGSIFGFLGPNGAGKSTTIKTLL